MNRIQALYASSIGKKFIVAVTGFIMFGFLMGHVAGHMKIFTGVSDNGVPHIDEYGEFLRTIGAPAIPPGLGLWTARFVLLVTLLLHVMAVSHLAKMSFKARPTPYVRSKKRAASLPAMWMMFSGILILGFIVFHILHLTTGTIVIGEFEHGTVYNNMASTFSHPVVAIGYVIMMIVLGFHLVHGVWSLFQTLGIDNPDRNRGLRIFAIVATIGIVVGYALIPIVFLTGILDAVAPYAHDLLGGH